MLRINTTPFRKNCFDQESHKKYYDNLRKEAYSLMEKAICPVCKMQLYKNGKDTHTKTKLKVCQEILRKKLDINNPQFELDGKQYEARVGIGKN